eukprot:scaffold140497_cov29-Tisochrysis_lutea.AAC.4
MERWRNGKRTISTKARREMRGEGGEGDRRDDLHPFAALLRPRIWVASPMRTYQSMHQRSTPEIQIAQAVNEQRSSKCLAQVFAPVRRQVRAPHHPAS